MEKVTLNNVQLDVLADSDDALRPYFVGTLACDDLPTRPRRSTPQAYIVNTDPAGKPGRHWLGVWTDDQTCEVMDSYGLPLDIYQTTQPLQEWLDRHWKRVVGNDKSLQSPYSQSCGAYALLYLMGKARGQSMTDFLKPFSMHDFVDNDHRIGQMLRDVIQKQLYWDKISKKPFKQDTSRKGIRDLV